MPEATTQLTPSANTGLPPQATIDALIAKADGEPTPPPPPAKADTNAETKEPLLAGKFKTTEELAKAYQELQAKLGSAKATKSEEPANQPKEGEDSLSIPAEAVTAVTEAGFDMNELAAEFTANQGLTEATYEKLASKGFDKETVDTFIEGQQALAREYRSTVFSYAGGEDEYVALTSWAAQALSPEEKATFNSAVNGKDRNLAQLAVAGLQARMIGAVGKEPNLVSGKGSSSDGGYESDAQMTADMKDPRFKSDPAFRALVQRKAKALVN